MTFSLLLLAVLAVTSIALFLIWSEAPKVSPEQNVSPEWLALVANRDSFERDPAMSEEMKHALREEWLASAEQFNAEQLVRKLAAASSSPSQSATWRLPLTIAISIGILGTLLYLVLATLSAEALQWPPKPSLGMPAGVAMSDNGAGSAKHPGDEQNMENRVAQLEKRLREKPEDVDGWVLLARSKSYQRDFAGSAEALRRALALVPGHPDLLADLADNLAMLQQRSLKGEPEHIVQQILQAQPNHQKGLALAATAALQNGKREESLTLWRRLQGTYPAGAAEIAQIDQLLEQFGLAASAEPKPNTNAAETEKVESTDPVFQGQVVLSKSMISALPSPLPDTAVLFVYAKQPDGPPMPIAVMRGSVATLVQSGKLPFRLDDTMSINPARRLSQTSVVNLEARIALDGNAMKQSGDVYGVLRAVKPGNQMLTLQLDQRVP